MSKLNEFQFNNVELPVGGGLNLVDNPHAIEDNEFSELLNFEVSGQRLIQRNGIKLRGQGSFNTKNVRLLGYISDPTNDRAIVVGQAFNFSVGSLTDYVQDKLYYSTDGCVTWTELQFTGPTSFECIAYKAITYGYTNTMYIGTEKQVARGDLYSWTGTGLATLVATQPIGFIGDIVLSRLFCYFDRQIRYSDPNNFASMTGTISIIESGTRSMITSAIGYKDRLVIFFDNAIYVLYLTGTPTNWSLKTFVQGIGATGTHAVTMVDDWIYFIGRQGVYRTNLSTVEEISVPFRDLFYSRTSSGTNTLIKQPHGMWDSIGYYNNRLICNINFGGVFATNSRRHRMFVFNTVEEVWSEWKPNITSTSLNNYKTFTNMMTIDKTRDVNTDEQFPIGVYFGSAESDGNVYIYNEDQPANDESGNFDCIARSKIFTFDKSLSYKKIPFMNALVKGDGNQKIEFKHVVNSVEGAAFDPIVPGDLTTTPKSFKFKGPGYTQTYGYNLRVTTPASTATNRAEVILLGMGVREARPVQVKAKP